MQPSEKIIDELRNAAAEGRLVVMTGAGISYAMKRPNGKGLPSWGKLVSSLRDKLPKRKKLSPADSKLLDDLLPKTVLDKVHGDALIEASEILQSAYGKQRFAWEVAALCREAKGQTTETHRAIAEIRPAGIITFNYDHGHETAFEECDVEFESMLYSDDALLRERIRRPPPHPSPFLLKAHGSVDKPKTLVLTGSSYKNVLHNSRPYRAFLERALTQYCFLIVGFALRDRDFDLLLTTLEREFGRPIQRHAFIACLESEKKMKRREKLIARATWASLKARFAIEPIFVDKYSGIPPELLKCAKEPGSRVKSLIRDSISKDGKIRRGAHNAIRVLGPLGKQQVRHGITTALNRPRLTLEDRSEMIYALGQAAEEVIEVPYFFVDEVIERIRRFKKSQSVMACECVAHALLMLRATKLTKPSEAARFRVLSNAGTLRALQEMDVWLESKGEIKRLETYALTAAAEIESRKRALKAKRRRP